MQKQTKKWGRLIKYFAISAASFVILFLVTDIIIMPLIVSSEEIILPDLSGKDKNSAIKILEELDLIPVLEGPKYVAKVPKDKIFLQKPRPGTKVKTQRNVYLFYSGGEPVLKIPNVTGKTLRDAKLTLERAGLVIRNILEVPSELPPNSVIEQVHVKSLRTNLKDSIDLKISFGPQIGKIRVPGIIGESLSQAEKILKKYSLELGKINYVPSSSLLPNTVVDQYPSRDKLVSLGDSVDVFISRESVTNFGGN